MQRQSQEAFGLLTNSEEIISSIETHGPEVAARLDEKWTAMAPPPDDSTPQLDAPSPPDYLGNLLALRDGLSVSASSLTRSDQVHVHNLAALIELRDDRGKIFDIAYDKFSAMRRFLDELHGEDQAFVLAAMESPTARTPKKLLRQLDLSASHLRTPNPKLALVKVEGVSINTVEMASALSSPLKARGRWGELTLRRVAELAGMSEHCDFSEQETFTTEAGRQRPDMIVNLPGNRRIAVDAKVPLQAFIEAVDPDKPEEEKRKALERHSELVRAHLNQLAERRYWDQVGPELELVVLFLPGESFFSAALEQDRELIEDGMKKHVVLATPTTLIALLHAVAYGWRQEQVARNAQDISDLGKEVYDRMKTFLGHFEGIGSSLHRATDNYNKAVGSLESRVLPSTRKFKELGAATGEEIAELETVDETPRVLNAPEQNGGN